jgi:heme exporter protein B
VAVLLAGLLNLDALFRGDLEDGSLEQMMLSPVPLAWLVALRVLAHWCVSALPLLLLAPVLGELLHLPRHLLPPLLLSLALGTPLLSLLGAVVAALTVGIRRSGMLLALLALPLFVPVLVFGAGAVAAAAEGLPWLGAIYLLAAGLALSLVLAPLAAATALRIALS